MDRKIMARIIDLCEQNLFVRFFIYTENKEPFK